MWEGYISGEGEEKSGRNVPSGQEASRRGGWHSRGSQPGGPADLDWLWPRVERGGQALRPPGWHSDGAGSRQLQAGPALC